MSRKPFMAFIFLLVMQSGYANDPNWNDVKWSCPSSVKMGGVEFSTLERFSVFDGSPENLSDLAPESEKSPQFLQLEKRNTYIVCRYTGLESELIIHAKGAAYCGLIRDPVRAGCWVGSSP